MSKILIASKAAVLFLGFSYGFWSEKYCKGRGNKGKLKAGKQATHTHTCICSLPQQWFVHLYACAAFI